METTAATTLENQAQSLVFTHEQLQLQNTEAQKKLIKFVIKVYSRAISRLSMRVLLKYN